MQEDTIYRCVNPACARLMPRPVKFCPWCGTAQATGQAPARDEGPAVASAAAMGTTTAATAAAAARDAAGPADTRAAAARENWSDAPAPPPAAGAGVRAGAAPPEPDPARAAAAAAAATAAGTAAARAGLAGADADPRAGAQAEAGARTRGAGLGTLFGHGARTSAAQPAAAAPDSVPRPAIPPRPAAPQRTPIQLRWWLLVLLILWGVWMVARPNGGRQIERRIDHATALAKACKAREAQDELIALRTTRATPEQLERLQDALNDGAAACTRKRQRDKAWMDTAAGAESALSDGNPERASARLQAFTRRWGDDERSRALRTRIEDARHPLAAPEG